MGDIGNIIADILPIFAIMILGYLGGKLHKFDNDQMQGLNKVVLGIALPAALFLSITKATREMLFSDLPLTLVSPVVVIGMSVLSFFLCWKTFKHNIAEAAVCALIAGSPTIDFLGFAVLDPLFGTGTQTGLMAAIVAIIVNAVTIPIGFYLVNKGLNAEAAKSAGKTKLAATGTAAVANNGAPAAPAQGKKTRNSNSDAVIKSLKQPVMRVPISAAMLVLLGIKFPSELDPCFNLIAKANSDLAVFTAGIVLSTVKFSLGKETVWNVFYRNLLTLTVGLALGLVCGIHGVMLQMFVLAIALPPTFSGIIISSRYNIYVREGASTAAVSTLAFAATMPLWIVITPMIEHLFGA